MLATWDMIATLFILPWAWIHYLLQMERFLAVRDFQLPIQSCNRQFSGIAHFTVISTFMSCQYPLVSHVACDWCVWVLAIIINKNLRIFHKLHLVKWSVPAAQYSMRMLLHYSSTTTSNLSTSQHETACCYTYARISFIQPILAKTKCPSVTCSN